MRVSSDGVVDGYFLDRYGAKGTEFRGDMPSLSVPFDIEDAPDGTLSFAVVLDDYDAIPVCGFDWIHWTISDLTKTSVREGESHNGPDFTEGCNSFHSVAGDMSAEDATGYGGMAPPDREHRYTLKVYALDTVLDLERGFLLNDLYFAMQGHVLAHAKLIGKYSPEYQDVVLR